MASRATIGDIIEIPGPYGLAYAQYTHEHTSPPKLGSLLRMLPGTYESRPANLLDLVYGCERFYAFYPLSYMLKEGAVRIVAHAPVPEHAREFPLFRAAGNIDEGTGRVVDWWLWDGQREWRIGELTPELLRLPIRSIVSHELLVERIASGWLPKDRG